MMSEESPACGVNVSRTGYGNLAMIRSPPPTGTANARTHYAVASASDATLMLAFSKVSKRAGYLLTDGMMPYGRKCPLPTAKLDTPARNPNRGISSTDAEPQRNSRVS